MHERPRGNDQQLSLVELLDRLLDRGVVLTGDLTISVADVDLIHVALNVVIASIERMKELPQPLSGAEKE